MQIKSKIKYGTVHGRSPRQVDALVSLQSGTEKELRETKVPWLKTVEELNKIIELLTKRSHDYGTWRLRNEYGRRGSF